MSPEYREEGVEMTRSELETLIEAIINRLRPTKRSWNILDKSSKIMIILLEVFLVSVVIYFITWYNLALNMVAAGSAQGAALVGEIAKAAGSLSVIGTFIGVVLPALIGAMRLFNKKIENQPAAAKPAPARRDPYEEGA